LRRLAVNERAAHADHEAESPERDAQFVDVRGQTPCARLEQQDILALEQPLVLASPTAMEFVLVQMGSH
jgi:hypothetical protein